MPEIAEGAAAGRTEPSAPHAGRSVARVETASRAGHVTVVARPGERALARARRVVARACSNSKTQETRSVRSDAKRSRVR